MPVKIRPELQALRAAAKAPRDGYFSVLDELIGQLPDRPIWVAELRQRLKPGRILKREDMVFPLKKEELDYALPELGQWGAELKQDPKNLRDFVRKRRPAFEVDDVHNEGEYSRYTTQGPDRVGHYNDGEDYFATTTDSPNISPFKEGHYNDGTISFSRGSRHELPGGGGILRLIDEIQNDRANAARSRAHDFVEAPEDGADFVEPPIRGWRTPEDQAKLDQVARDHPDVHDFPGWNDDRSAMTVPDAPFKTPQEYGRLEIKNQLLDALADDDAALGITPASGPASWFPGTGAKDTTYDKVYPGELRKIANQYGAPFEDVPLRVNVPDNLNLPTLAGTDFPDFRAGAFEHPSVVTTFDELYGVARDLEAGGYVDDSAFNKLSEMEEEVRAVMKAQANGELSEQEMLGVMDDYANMIEDLYENASASKFGAQGEAVRKIPSMRLTPEVKDRISRIGLPLFTAAGAAALSPEMMQEPDMFTEDQPQGFAEGGSVASRAAGTLHRISEGRKDFKAKRAGNLTRRNAELTARSASLKRQIHDAEAGRHPADLNALEEELHTVNGQLDELFWARRDSTDGFAKGGMVGRASGALKGIREASERAAAARGGEQDWLRELTTQGEPRRPTGDPAHGAAGEYGAWAEGPTKAPRNYVERLPESTQGITRPMHPLRSRASDAERLMKGYNAFADEMEMSPRRRQYFVDANKLKALNDNYGFSVGDRLIELQNQLLRDELAGLDPSVGAIMARGPGDEVYLAGNDDESMRRAIERANDKLLTEGVHMDTPQGKRTISGVASLKYGAGDDLEAAERDLMARKAAGIDDRADASEAIEVLEAPRYRAQGGSLNAMRTHLNNYAAGGGVSLADQYADAVDGEYEDGDEFLDEDDDYEYYACGGEVHGYSLGGKLKKAVKKVAKGIGKVANLPGKMLSKVPGVKSVASLVAKAAPVLGFVPGIGTVAGGLIGGIAGNIASGGKTSGFLKGALAGASGGIGSGIAKSVAGKLGGGLLAKIAGGAVGSGASSLIQGAGGKLIKNPYGTPSSQEIPDVLNQNGNAPLVPNMLDAQQQAIATNAAAPTQLSMLQQTQQAQPRVQPGSNANGLLARIQQQQQQQPVSWQQLQPIQQPIG